jgi:hypothetical protein
VEGFHGNRGLVPQACQYVGLMSPTRRILNHFPRPSRGTRPTGRCGEAMNDEEIHMDIVHERAAGIDISKRDAKVCIRVPGDRAGTFRKTVTTYAATTNEILRLRHDLEEAAVTVVAMEATGDYWKPFFFLLDETLNVELVNAKHPRNIPGRKTDVSDVTWLAELAAHNLLRASFVPPEEILSATVENEAIATACIPVVIATGADSRRLAGSRRAPLACGPRE